LAINGPEGERLLGGASQNWSGDQEAEVYEKSGGGWELRRRIVPSLMWEIEFDEHGRVWEFFNDWSGAVTAALFVDGEEKTPPPGGDISSANWFPVTGHMYTIGAIGSGNTDRNQINRSANGDEWEHVYTLPHAHLGDHILYVPRGEGELWAVGHDPFEAAYTLDGETWTLEESVPSFATGVDTNHITAVAYWGPDNDDEKDRGVWLFAYDATADACRIFTDHGAGGALLLQVI
jgi:hypothetical protein